MNKINKLIGLIFAIFVSFNVYAGDEHSHNHDEEKTNTNTADIYNKPRNKQQNN